MHARRTSPDFLLGLPTLVDNELWRAAERLDAPVLVSANALSLWRRDQIGLRRWIGFDRRNLHLVWQRPVSLDSGGFVAAVRYRGFPWTVQHYMELCAAAPWTWFASADLCVEPEVARDRDAVLDRISGTVRLNRDCLIEARERGIADRLVPVIQGWRPDDYRRFIDRMPDLSRLDLIGVGSMCRRQVGGDDGILRVVDVLDRAFEGTTCRLHLFGIKTAGMSAVRGHSRIASVDSQAYGTTARWTACKTGARKSNAWLARTMSDWYRTQRRLLGAGDFVFRPPAGTPPREEASPAMPANMRARLAAAMESLRALHETGEIELSDVSMQTAWHCAFLDDEDENTEPECDPCITHPDAHA